MAKARERAYLLHGFVLARGTAPREAIFRRMGLTIGDRDDEHRFKQHVYMLRKELDLTFDGYDPIVMDDDGLDVDLWNVLEWAKKGSSNRSLDKAQDLIEERGDVFLYETSDDPGHELWEQTLIEFEQAKARALAPRRRSGAAARAVREMRDTLLEREVAPGVADRARIRDVVDMVREMKGMRHPEEDGAPIAAVLADQLEGLRPGHQSRIVLTGTAGAGKTVTATLTYLELAARFEAGEDPALVPLFFDGLREGFEEGFADDAWFKERLAAAGIEDGRQPIVIIGHADAFLAHVDDLERVLTRDIFQVDRLLLCCGQTFHARRLHFRDLHADPVPLGQWPREWQEDFAEVTLGPGARVELRSWLDEDVTREELCAVPLHLVFVLSLLSDPEKLPDLSTAGQLFEAIAWVRLSHDGGDTMSAEMRLEQLGRVAHHFYVDARATTGAPIRFKRAALRTMLRQSGGKVGEGCKEWTDELEHHTLLTSNDGRDPLSFEHPSWGQFFVARHIASTLVDRPEEALPTFAKFLSLEVASFCEDLLSDDDLESVRRALIDAISADAPQMSRHRERIAREQVCYFLGAVGHQGVRAELRQLADPESDLYEEDDWIRRGVLFGLADGGDATAADMYVDALRAEREAGGSDERDTNIGFHLTFRGDQEFDLERPDGIGRNPQCVRTVVGLVRGLEQERHDCSRRIKLFTLLELAAHPGIPPDRFDAAIEPHVDALAKIGKRLKDDPESASWPELGELEHLLEARRSRSRGA